MIGRLRRIHLEGLEHGGIEHGGIEYREIETNISYEQNALKDKVVVFHLGAKYSNQGINQDGLLSKKQEDSIVVQQELHEKL